MEDHGRDRPHKCANPPCRTLTFYHLCARCDADTRTWRTDIDPSFLGPDWTERRRERERERQRRRQAQARVDRPRTYNDATRLSDRNGTILVAKRLFFVPPALMRRPIKRSFDETFSQASQSLLCCRESASSSHLKKHCLINPLWVSQMRQRLHSSAFRFS
jgi:hypothetical protein